MGLFRRTKRVFCPANSWTTLIWNIASGMPATWSISFVGHDGQVVQGRYREQRGWWIFPQTPVEGPLLARMSFHRKWINAYYHLQICPERDLEAVIE